MMKRLCSFLRGEEGTQFVELAVVLPVMLLMIGATAEFGRFFYTYSTLAKATRAGARYLANKPIGEEVANTKSLVICGDPSAGGVCAAPVVPGLTTSMVVVTPTSGFPNTVTVSIVGYKYQPLFDLGKMTGSNLSLSVDVSPSVTMKYLLD